MLSPSEERVIWRAARAQRRYWQLVRRLGDDARRRHGVLTRYVEVQAELRGDRDKDPPAGPVDCWIPLHEAVSRELARRRPLVRVEVMLQREARRLAVGCGRAEIQLGFRPRARRRLRRIIWDSGLSIREVADAIGVASSTLERHLGGRMPCRERTDWYLRLESVSAVDDYLLITVKRAAPTRKCCGWRKPIPPDDDE
jgi:hypothetical protein